MSKNSLAIAYAMKRKAKKMADGGFLREEEDSGYHSMPKERERMNDCAEEEDDDMDMVGRIMKQKAHKYSDGGRVANQEHGPEDDDMADFSRNEFDDMVLDDDLDSSYSGANSGDEIGDMQEDDDRDDMISQIMKSKRMKDRMPIPGYGTSYGRNK